MRRQPRKMRTLSHRKSEYLSRVNTRVYTFEMAMYAKYILNIKPKLNLPMKNRAVKGLQMLNSKNAVRNV